MRDLSHMVDIFVSLYRSEQFLMGEEQFPNFFSHPPPLSCAFQTSHFIPFELYNLKCILPSLLQFRSNLLIQ